MKFSENWLRTLVNPSCSSDELAHRLTMAGLEVESVESVAPIFDKVIVAEVLSVEKHPAADRLNICLVDIGDAKHGSLQIVCGAPNVRAGVKVPCALIGARLPGFLVNKAKLRGVESSGMLCSAKELGLSETAEGLLLLPYDAPVGLDFRNYYKLDDKIFTLKLTPNRADCLGILGIAREVSAITSTELDTIKVEPAPCEIQSTLAVQVIAREACPLYCGRIIKEICLDVPTPLWITQRLERSGIRSVNIVVDVTNYVLLETGQPLHAFNLEKIKGSIQIRYSQSGEKIQLLNGTKIDLEPDMLIIADENVPLALAGIMGGNSSGVEQGTTDIFLESAFFNPDVISGKSFRLGFNSDSAHRFERGVDFAFTRDALERATRIIMEICGGKAGPVIEVKYTLPQRSWVTVRTERVKRVLGVDIDKHQLSEIFKRLKFDFSNSESTFSVMPPSYRFDLAIEEDFIEEIARLHGYDCITGNFPHANMIMLPAAEKNRSAAQIKQIMTLRDYQEVINYAFVNEEWETDFINNKEPIILKNPIASQMNVMRSSLIGGLIANLQFNLNRKQTRIRLFEIGCCFERDNGSDCTQKENLAGLCYGDAYPEQWGVPARSIDFFDVKADIEALFWPRMIHFDAKPHPVLHPGKSARICSDLKNVGWMGELHPRWQKKYDLPKPAVIFEIHLDSLLTRSIPFTSEISKFPPIRRDIAVIVDNHISVQSLLECMYAKKLTIVSEITLFDMYQGKGVSNNKKSLAFRILLQDTERTLTDEEADTAITCLITVLEDKFGASLRN